MAVPARFRYFPGLHRQLHSRKLEFPKPGAGGKNDVLVKLITLSQFFW